MINVRVTTDDFDVGDETRALSGRGIGAVASFVGRVRGDDQLVSLTLEHYPAMTEQSLQNLAERAVARWLLGAVTIVHRVGTLVPGDQIVFAGTSSKHRADAIEAMSFLIDCLKTQAPFWKREVFADGRTVWLEGRATDAAATSRWD